MGAARPVFQRAFAIALGVSMLIAFCSPAQAGELDRLGSSAGIGSIAGRVVEAATGEPIAAIEISIWDHRGQFAGRVETRSDGTYLVAGLRPGTYFAATFAFRHYVDELYRGHLCLPGCAFTSGTPIEVGTTQVSGIDFALLRFGAVSGRVVEAATGAPLAFVEVVASRVDGEGSSSQQTAFDGRYEIDDLRAGSYVVATDSDAELLDQVYAGRLCQGPPRGDCDPTSIGTAIEVTFGRSTTGIDFALHSGASISGSVREHGSGEPVLALVDLFRDDGLLVATQGTEFGTGAYEIGALAPGTYFSAARSSEFERGLIDGLYNGIDCPRGPGVGCEPTAGTPIAVSDRPISGIDFALRRRGTIRGRVIDAGTGSPISNAAVIAIGPPGQGSAEVDADGRYEIVALHPGTYAVFAFENTGPFRGYLSELYAEMPCPQFGQCDVEGGTPVTVRVDSVTSGIDFTFDLGGEIRGTVVDAATGLVIPGALVELFAAGQGPMTRRTDGDGAFSFQGRLASSYYLAASNASEGYARIAHPGVDCGFVTCSPFTAGTPIPLAHGETIEVGFRLPQGGRLEGRVTDAVTGQPVYNNRVYLWDAEGKRLYRGTESHASYLFQALSPGTYYLSAETPGTHIAEVFDDIPCDPVSGCDPLIGAPIEIGYGQTISNLDFVLEHDGCFETPTSLCLNDRRFRVEVEWQTARDAGEGVARVLTADAGYFWFFNAANIETVVKVLDNCNGPTHRFWVFAAGLTDQGARLRVTDTVTGEVQVYESPLGTPFQPILDTAAFATCGAEGKRALEAVDDVSPALARGVGTVSGRVLDAFTGAPVPDVDIYLWEQLANDLAANARTSDAGQYRFAGVAEGTYFVQTDSDDRYFDKVWQDQDCHFPCDPTTGNPIVVAGSATVEGIDFELVPVPCGGSDDSLCLRDRRFKVKVRWRTPGGDAGVAQAKPLTSDTGYFWFFRPKNIEVVVKVLDNCNGPTGKFWVFAGGLTDLEVELAVTDTVTGAFKTYRNAQGQPFQPILDTGAFDTCP